MSSFPIITRFPLPPGTKLGRVRDALVECIRTNTGDELRQERSLDTETSAWDSELAGRVFCGEIQHDPAKHEMQLVGIVPGINSVRNHMDIVVFLHQAGPNQKDEWEVCFVWSKSNSRGKRSDTKSGGEINMIQSALANLPLLLEHKLNN